MQCANQYRQFWETQFDALATYLEATFEEEKSISLPTRTTARVVPTIHGLHKAIRRIVGTTLAVVLVRLCGDTVVRLCGDTLVHTYA